MKIEIDTKEDSHEEIKKVISLLQHLVGDQEVFSNAPVAESGATASAFNNIFGDNPSSDNSSNPSPIQAASDAKEEAEETTESTDDLFAELFSEEELKKMEPVKEEEEIKPYKKKYSVEFY